MALVKFNALSYQQKVRVTNEMYKLLATTQIELNERMTDMPTAENSTQMFYEVLDLNKAIRSSSIVFLITTSPHNMMHMKIIQCRKTTCSMYWHMVLDCMHYWSAKAGRTSKWFVYISLLHRTISGCNVRRVFLTTWHLQLFCNAK